MSAEELTQTAIVASKGSLDTDPPQGLRQNHSNTNGSHEPPRSSSLPDSAMSNQDPSLSETTNNTQQVEEDHSIEQAQSMTSSSDVERDNKDSDRLISLTSPANPPALVTVRTNQDNEVRKNEEMKAVDSDSDQLMMDIDNNYNELGTVTSSRSDREDSPELVIDTRSVINEDENRPAPLISENHLQREENEAKSKETRKSRESSYEEIDMDVPLEESSDEESTNNNSISNTPHLKYVSRSSTPQNGNVMATTNPHIVQQSVHPSSSTVKRNEETPGNYGNESGSRARSVSPGYHAKQVAKLKQFFTTLQGFGNKLGREGAEQVQELITALVNKTATIEEFHQEIQTVTNHPLKQFIIPFLRENLDYLRDELKESSRALSDILNQDTEVPPQNSFALTPQLADDELPVYKTPQSAGTSKSSLGTIVSRRIQTSSSDWKNGHKVTKPSHMTTQVMSHGVATVSSKLYGTGSGPNSRANLGSHVMTHPPTVAGTRMSPVEMRTVEDQSRGAGLMRKRDRDMTDDRMLIIASQEKDTQTITSSKQYASHNPKRPRTDISSFPDDVIITTSTRHISHPPPYPHPPLTYPIPSTTPSSIETASRGRDSPLLEDWKHVDMMLTSMQGMMERTRQAVTLLKERITVTQAEAERREVDREALIQQKVHEAVEKVKQRAEEEKQHVLAETRKQIRDAVATVRSEMETRVSSAQSTALQDALKDANKQSNSKENCWNCGRRATETCSGCNKARYCGTFCQHKDWANHMHHCASGLQVQQNSMETVYDRRRQTATTNDVTMMSSGRGKGHPRIPVNLVQGGSELNLRHIASGHIPHSHTDIAVTVKTEKS